MIPTEIRPVAGLRAKSEPSGTREVLKHVAALDGVRGLAILTVLLHHLLWSSPHTGSRLMDEVVKIRAAGWVGVDLFFALSGFLITGILWDSLHDRHFFQNFYARRILRIFPLYYGVIFILFLLFHSRSLVDQEPLYLLLAYLQNTPLWWRQRGGKELIDLTGHLWSLAVEEQFYMVWPLVVFWVRDRQRLLWVTAGLSVAALLSRIFLIENGSLLVTTYKLTFCRADSLLGGAWLALIVRGPSKERVLRLAWPVFCLAVAACGLIAWSNSGFDWENNRSIGLYGYSVLAIASTALIAMAIQPLSITARLMDSKYLRFLGKYSYGIYVFHQMISGMLAVMLGRFLQERIHSKAAYHVTSFLLVSGTTLVISILSYHFYEKPFLKMKRFFNYGTN